MNNILSILICSLPERQKFLNELLQRLTSQLVEGVQVVVNTDSGKKPTGLKRNELIKGADGKYIVFIDDDDMVSKDYVPLILKAVEGDCDVVGIHLLMTTKGSIKTECRTYHSLKYKEWWDEPDPDRPGKKRYYRNPNHLNPVKREFAISVGFPEINSGEDHDYSKRLLPLLKTEVYIEKAIYHYIAQRPGT